jgi:peptide/nickel transport system ATP-binding protein
MLRVQNLKVTYTGPPPVRAVDGLDLSVAGGECLGVLGESGSGKSSLARAMLGLCSEATVTGSIQLGDIDLDCLDEKGWQRIRWNRLALVFQSTASLNPVLRIGQQIAESLAVHTRLGDRAIRARIDDLLVRVGLGDWAADRYPRELSGGQRRLCLMAMALACDPDVIILDEPTAGLDPLRREQVLDLLAGLRDAGHTLLMFTHDVASLQIVADRVGVMYRGWLAEVGPTATVLEDPRNPYTWGLLNAHPTLGTVKDLRGIRGTPPDPTVRATGCPFLERCTQAVDDCHHDRPPLVAPTGESNGRVVACVRGGLVPVLEARDVRKHYRVRRGALRHDDIPAVDGISLTVREGEVVGVVGPTGAGKSTLGQLLLRLVEPDSGHIVLEGRDLTAAGPDQMKAARRRAQLLFQDPFEALSPRMTIRQVVREPLDVQQIGDVQARNGMVEDIMREVRLPPEAGFLDRHTHELSGGQLQRVALARALVLDPKLLIADEAVAMLDPSEQTKLVQLLKHLQVERGMAMLFVSHDLAIVLRIADRVVVLDEGRIVEEAPSTRLLTHPTHPTTRRLLAASGAVFTTPVNPQPAHPAQGAHNGHPDSNHHPDRQSDGTAAGDRTRVT